MGTQELAEMNGNYAVNLEEFPLAGELEVGWAVPWQPSSVTPMFLLCSPRSSKVVAAHSGHR